MKRADFRALVDLGDHTRADKLCVGDLIVPTGAACIDDLRTVTEVRRVECGCSDVRVTWRYNDNGRSVTQVVEAGTLVYAIPGQAANARGAA